MTRHPHRKRAERATEERADDLTALVLEGLRHTPHALELGVFGPRRPAPEPLAAFRAPVEAAGFDHDGHDAYVQGFVREQMLAHEQALEAAVRAYSAHGTIAPILAEGLPDGRQERRDALRRACDYLGVPLPWQHAVDEAHERLEDRVLRGLLEDGSGS